jgi:hypothetical protein
MKPLLFGSVALVLFAVSAMAQNPNAPIEPNELTTTATANRHCGSAMSSVAKFRTR